MQISDKALLSINPASSGQLVKTLIALETHGIFIHFDIVWPLVCNSGTKHCQNIQLPPSSPPQQIHFSIDFIFLSFGIMGFIVEL